MAERLQGDGRPPWPGGNPFNVTKATDLSNDEIQRMWVDLAADGGYLKVIDPTVPMPRFLLGGKGTGRTHLMRYLSVPLQLLRNPGNPWDGPVAEGYLGIFLRFGGLNAGRFRGKGVSDDAWEDIFPYSVDLSLASLALQTACIAFGPHPEFADKDTAIARDVCAQFGDYPTDPPGSVQELRVHLGQLQRELDLAVNNAALKRGLGDVTIRVTRGRLPFAIPQIFAHHLAVSKDVSWLYLLDELENVTESQQRYVQTLVREREAPSSFIVGARTYGVRTRLTLSAGEENKEGSEYSAVELDHLYLQNRSLFGEFCRQIVTKRLVDAGHRHVVPDEIERYFVEPSKGGPARDGEVEFVSLHHEEERRYLLRLRQQLEEHLHFPPERAARLVDDLRVPEHPLLERLNVLLVYQAWNAKNDLSARAAEIGDQARTMATDSPDKGYKRSFSHYGGDMVAKLLQEYGQRQRYLGLDTFIYMAGGLPRNLLVILKNIFQAAEFNGEAPFQGKPISERSQRSGVQRASEWFYRDARAMGEEGLAAERGVSRVADLMRALRFADKPPEVSLSSFSLNFDALDEAGQAALRTAATWSLLLEIKPGQRDKNTGAIESKFQLNPMLSPRWDLPTARRGALDLDPAEANAIFSQRSDDDFDEVRRIRLARASVPFGGHRKQSEQASLLNDGD